MRAHPLRYACLGVGALIVASGLWLRSFPTLSIVFARNDPVLPAHPERVDADLAQLIRRHVDLVRESPRDAGRHGVLGLVYEANHLWIEARTCFETAARLDQDAPVWLRHAAIAMQEIGSHAEALDLLQRATLRFPDCASLQHRLGEALLREGDSLAARRAFERAVAAAPSAYQAHAGLGEACLVSGETDGAIEALSRAVQLNRDYSVSHYLLGLAYRERGRSSEAERELSIGRDSFKHPLPDAGDAELERYAVGPQPALKHARQMLKSGRSEEAIAILEDARARHPLEPMLLSALGAALLNAGRIDEALTVLREAESTGTHSAAVEADLSAALLARGDAREALRCAEAAILAAPQSARGHWLRGQAALAVGDAEAAHAGFLAAQRLDPHTPAIRLWLGRVALAAGRFEEARAELSQAVDSSPGDWRAQVELCRACLHLGELVRAGDALASAQRLAPDDTLVKSMAAELAGADRK